MFLNTSKKDLVSVIIPVYNAEKFIEASVESVLRQSYRNFEVIIINDGSTDNTGRQLARFKSFANVKLIERENRGIVATLNEAVRHCEGAYIMRMDADDICVPERMEWQLSFLKEKGLDMTGSAIQTFGGYKSITRKYIGEDEKIKFQLLFASCFAHPALFCKREVLADNPYDAGFEKIEDYELWTRLAAAGYRMGNCSEVLLKYRVHRKQITSANRAFQDRKRIEIAQKYSNAYLSSGDFSQVLADLLGRNFAYLDEAKICSINGFYTHLMEHYGRYADIVHYHFFLCFLHNHFATGPEVPFIGRLPFLKKNLLLGFNKSRLLKRIPIQVYRKLY